MIDSLKNYLFESSWETCNKVGGIYSVISSKAEQIVKTYGDKYFLIGPKLPGKETPEFEEKQPPQEIEEVFKILKQKGINCQYGRWLVKGEPQAILIDFYSLTREKDQIKKQLWDEYKIDSIYSQWEFEEPVIWSWTVGMLIEEFSKKTNEKIIAQLHEWMAGAALLYIKKQKLPIATIFTTHATMLGRSIAGSGRKLYQELKNINPEEEAYRSGIQAKYQIEKACAHNADVFATVSEITSIEAEHILGKKPDIITPNGLDMIQFPNFEERAIKHVFSKNRLKDFTASYFFPYQSFDIENTMFYCTFGRYEFHNKGIDTYLRALAMLNQKLKEEKSEKTIINFFWIPTGTQGIKKSILENKAFYDDIKIGVNQYINEIKVKILNAIVNQQDLTKIELFNKDFLLETKKEIIKFTKQGNPPISTHNLMNESSDAIVGTSRALGLNNDKEDRVKIVFQPVYLDGTDGVLDLEYYDAMVGSQLGIFPSYYEPWGYTPLESAAMGVPAVTTDAAGFGRWVLQNTKKEDKPGVYVLDRLGKEDQETDKELFEFLYNYTNLPKQERMNKKLDAKRIAEMADWKELVENYKKAFEMAISKIE